MKVVLVSNETRAFRTQVLDAKGAAALGQVPKALLPVLDLPILEHWVKSLTKYERLQGSLGDCVLILTGPEYQSRFSAWLKESPGYGLSVERNLLVMDHALAESNSTAARVAYVSSKYPGESVVLLPVDALFLPGFNLGGIIERFLIRGKTSVLVIPPTSRNQVDSSAITAEVETGNRVLRVFSSSTVSAEDASLIGRTLHRRRGQHQVTRLLMISKEDVPRVATYATNSIPTGSAAEEELRLMSWLSREVSLYAEYFRWMQQVDSFDDYVYLNGFLEHLKGVRMDSRNLDAIQRDFDIIFANSGRVRLAGESTFSGAIPERFRDPDAIMHKPREEHVSFQTESGTLGRKKVTVVDLPAKYFGLNGNFTRSFLGNTFRNSSLNCENTTSRVHNGLDDFGFIYGRFESGKNGNRS